MHACALPARCNPIPCSLPWPCCAQQHAGITPPRLPSLSPPPSLPALSQEGGEKIEYRVWNPFRSKLAAAVLAGVDNIHVKPGAKVGGGHGAGAGDDEHSAILLAGWHGILLLLLLLRRRGSERRGEPDMACPETCRPSFSVPSHPSLPQVLYLGAASGTSVSHVSDVVGPEGAVYAVEFSHRRCAAASAWRRFGCCYVRVRRRDAKQPCTRSAA